MALFGFLSLRRRRLLRRGAFDVTLGEAIAYNLYDASGFRPSRGQARADKAPPLVRAQARCGGRGGGNCGFGKQVG